MEKYDAFKSIGTILRIAFLIPNKVTGLLILQRRLFFKSNVFFLFVLREHFRVVDGYSRHTLLSGRKLCLADILFSIFPIISLSFNNSKFANDRKTTLKLEIYLFRMWNIVVVSKGSKSKLHAQTHTIFTYISRRPLTEFFFITFLS